MSMSLVRRFLLALCLVGTSAVSYAATPEAEIDHLLGFIASSSCTFIRNDVEYSGADAVAHIKDKYDYYKDKVHSAEDFIDRAATRSEMSGRVYMVRCAAEAPRPAATWLSDELAAFRKAP